MQDDMPMFMTPIQLHSYGDFQKIARSATAVLYRPEYFDSPFLDDKKRVRAVTIYAVGVRLSEVLLTFKYVVDYNEVCNEVPLCEDPMVNINEFMDDLLRSIGMTPQSGNEF